MSVIRGFAATLMVALLLFAGGCSDFDEMRSQSMLDKAKTLLEEGQNQQGEALLAELAKKYPQTESGQAAENQLKSIRQRRSFLERQEFAKILDSYRQVFNGYRSVYADSPKTLEEFDQSGYFFDSAYLQEITPGDFQVYLWLTGDENLFQAWCVRADQKNSYFADGSSPRLKKLQRDKVLAEMNSRFDVFEQKGTLFLIRPKS